MVSADVVRNSDERVRKEIEVLYKQTAFVSRKLREAQKDLKGQTLTIEYDNGGGQKGIRENPAFTAYEKLLNTYTRALTKLTELIGEKQVEDLPSIDSFRNKIRLVK